MFLLLFFELKPKNQQKKEIVFWKIGNMNRSIVIKNTPLYKNTPLFVPDLNFKRGYRPIFFELNVVL